jgi:N-acetylated-alpha-linked acidic dipeptidase
MQAKMLNINAFHLADDPSKSSGAPTPLKPVPHFNFSPLENAVDRLKKIAKAYDEALLAKGPSQPDRVKAQLFDLARRTEAVLAPDTGLPGRTWYKHLIYAPGRLTGYGAKTLPGVREAIEEEQWDDADKYAVITAAALNAYADQLDSGLPLLNGAASSASN